MIIPKWQDTDPLSNWLVPALIRFPLPFLVTLAWSLAANAQLADYRVFSDDVWDELLRIAVAGASFSLSALLICEARCIGYVSRQVIGSLAGGFFMALVWYVDAPDALEIIMIVSPFLFAFSAPYLGERGGEERFWLFSFRVVSLALVSLVAFVALCGGLSLILVTLDTLFGIGGGRYDELYGHIWLTGASLLWPALMLMGVPKRFDETPLVNETGFLFLAHRRINDFILAPLAIVYAGILHAYALMVLLTLQVPEGQIGWLVLCYGLLLIGFRLAANVLKGRAAAHTQWLLGNWAYLLIVPLVLLFIAIWLRVDAYGITVSRYYLIMFAAFLALAVAGFLLYRRSWLIIYLPALAALMLFSGTFGPWGAAELTVKSQGARLLAELELAGLLTEDGVGRMSGVYQRDEHWQIGSILAALNDADGLHVLEPLFENDPENPFTGEATEAGLYHAIGQRLGLFPAERTVANRPTENDRQPIALRAQDHYGRSISGYDEILRDIELHDRSMDALVREVEGKRLSLEGTRITIRDGAGVRVLALDDIRAKVEEAIAPGGPRIPDPLFIEAGDLAIAVLQVDVRTRDGQDYISSIRADIYLKKQP